ncbi:MAG: hypothetical protein UR51_C0017G0010 [Candidatus Moranbacteria bacterium GW2011_GWF1_34_10]|nr:MAG: hypothetical protein UR51_C0017G0010 [Candidatus Moranbacteria bacterium GW2011_GWF1_34_10]
MPNKISNDKKYDLIERTSAFGEAVIDFLKIIPKNEITKPLISQCVRSATSIGANYMEADCAESKKDFRHKIGICKKESKETMYWMRMLAREVDKEKDLCRILWKESQELTLIFSATINTLDENNKKSKESK